MSTMYPLHALLLNMYIIVMFVGIEYIRTYIPSVCMNVCNYIHTCNYITVSDYSCCTCCMYSMYVCILTVCSLYCVGIG